MDKYNDISVEKKIPYKKRSPQEIPDEKTISEEKRMCDKKEINKEKTNFILEEKESQANRNKFIGRKRNEKEDVEKDRHEKEK